MNFFKICIFRMFLLAALVMVVMKTKMHIYIIINKGDKGLVLFILNYIVPH
jgi:hypothetical protein